MDSPEGVTRRRVSLTRPKRSVKTTMVRPIMLKITSLRRRAQTQAARNAPRSGEERLGEPPRSVSSVLGITLLTPPSALLSVFLCFSQFFSVFLCFFSVFPLCFSLFSSLFFLCRYCLCFFLCVCERERERERDFEVHPNFSVISIRSPLIFGNYRK